MLGPLGLPEVLFILVLALLIFGPKRLPEMGRMLGKGLGEFRRATEDLKRSFNTELSLDDDERRPAPRRPAQLPGRDQAAKAAESQAGKAAEGEKEAAAAPAGTQPRRPLHEVEDASHPAPQAGGEAAAEPEPSTSQQAAGEESAKAAEPPAAG